MRHLRDADLSQMSGSDTRRREVQVVHGCQGRLARRPVTVSGRHNDWRWASRRRYRRIRGCVPLRLAYAAAGVRLWQARGQHDLARLRAQARCRYGVVEWGNGDRGHIGRESADCSRCPRIPTTDRNLAIHVPIHCRPGRAVPNTTNRAYRRRGRRGGSDKVRLEANGWGSVTAAASSLGLAGLKLVCGQLRLEVCRPSR